MRIFLPQVLISKQCFYNIRHCVDTSLLESMMKASISHYCFPSNLSHFTPEFECLNRAFLIDSVPNPLSVRTVIYHFEMKSQQLNERSQSLNSLERLNNLWKPLALLGSLCQKFCSDFMDKIA